MSVKSKLNNTLAADLQQWMPVDHHYLIGVSGGCDSMVLLHFLHSAGYRNLIVCHVNHSLRGEASDKDEALVANVGAGLGFQVESTQVDVNGVAELQRLSLETAARDLRYGWFSEVSARRGCSRVLTAHHADDQVETVLINLFRGSGSRGVSGMDHHSRRPVEGEELELFRPFLGVSRSEIEAYAAANDIAFREDESNSDDFALRNRVRNRLLPEIEEVFGRDIRGAVLRAAELARRDEAWMQQAAGELPNTAAGDGLIVKALREMPPARRDRLLLLWLRESGVPDCGYGEVSRVTSVLSSNDKPAKSSLPGGFHIRRREGVLFLERPDAGERRLDQSD